MTVDKFVEEFKAAENKNEFMRSHIRRRYIPIVEKMETADQVAKSADFIGGVYESHRSIGKMMFRLAAIEAYTDVEVERIDKDGNVQTDAEYDKLEEAGVYKVLEDILWDPHDSTSDLQAFEECYYDASDDLKDKETELWSVMKREIGGLNKALGVVAESVAEQIKVALKPEEIRQLFEMLKAAT